MKRPGTLVLVAAGVGAVAAAALSHVGVSRLVSKYIGETEKHLDGAFDAAEERDIVLLNDESDDLFRTDGTSDHDSDAG